MREAIVGCIFLLALGCIRASAADFAAKNLANCAMMMAGEIQAGDSAKFGKIAASLNLLKAKPGDYIYNETERAVCLDSPGGSWVEGRTIAGLVSEFGMTTRVLDGDECLSVCSLIFMAGRFRGEEFDGPSRYLHVRGRLGFHGPYLVPPEDRSYSASEMHAVSVAQNLVIADFIKFGSGGYAHSNGGAVSMSLVGEMLARGPDEMIYADTVERIARWNIALEGTRDDIRLDKNGMFQACENALNLPFDKPAETITPSRYESEPEVEIQRIRSSYGKLKVFARVQFSGDANRVCEIELRELGNGKIDTKVNVISICTDNGNTGILTGQCPDYSSVFPFYYALPPETPVGALAKQR